ncbi:MAG: Ig-like domain-containing protein, partial [Candidatus Thermoplasmatota archaeon]|nr:Ig-like domain-containing protein [Candidatus Thermoplasmatota archaeon]
MVHGTQVSVRTAFLACLLACFAMLILPGSEAELPVEDFTHAVIGEEFTATWCVYCPSAAENLYKVWRPKSEYPDDPYYDDQFFFVALITDVNDKADDRAGDYPDFTGYPTVYFDGGDEKVEGGQSDTSNYEQAIDNCGSRADTDISLRISMQHLGDDRIAVQAYITWNEDGGFGDPTFDGYIRAYIVEPISRYNNYDNEPYHFGFLDYAFDQEVELDSHEEVMLETVWVGGDHTDSNGDDFSDISYDNLNIFVSFFNNEQASADDYALQTAFAIPPDVNFWFPTEELSDTASLTGTASSPRTTIGSVEYKVDDGEWLLAEGTEEFDLQLDTTAYANGDHELLLRISNAFGTTRELTGTISIMNDGEAPEVEWLGPDSGSDVSGNVTLAALATDNDDVASVDYSINGGDWLPMEYIADNRWEAEWNTEVAGTENGEYTLVVRASDNYDNTATDSLTLTVANAGDVSYPEIILGEVPALPVADSFSVTVTA